MGSCHGEVIVLLWNIRLTGWHNTIAAFFSKRCSFTKTQTWNEAWDCLTFPAVWTITSPSCWVGTMVGKCWRNSLCLSLVNRKKSCCFFSSLPFVIRRFSCILFWNSKLQCCRRLHRGSRVDLVLGVRGRNSVNQVRNFNVQCEAGRAKPLLSPSQGQAAVQVHFSALQN